MAYSGLFDLRTPRDLLAKLRHDLARIENNWSDTYATFDFFVTADHIVDWLHPNDRPGQQAERVKSPLLQLCYHISSGAKHFEATNPTHKSVLATELHPGQFDSAQFDRSQFDVGTLGILLTDEAAGALGFNWLDARTLSRMVLAFWESHPAMKEQP
ncbi:MAG TPA: hypothetical protein VGN73_06920 [Gemmatimonadaceae bacterium]|nr:hypothetical protein [Gemmatimonadaceae bacterium]